MDIRINGNDGTATLTRCEPEEVPALLATELDAFAIKDTGVVLPRTVYRVDLGDDGPLGFIVEFELPEGTTDAPGPYLIAWRCSSDQQTVMHRTTHNDANAYADAVERLDNAASFDGFLKLLGVPER